MASTIASSLELDASTRHLIVGSVGAGKTTQLLMIAHRLREIPDIIPMYVDASEHQDLGKVEAGSLLALVGLELMSSVDFSSIPTIAPAAEHFRKWARGYERHIAEFESPPDDGYVRIPGVLSPPQPEWTDIPSYTVDRFASLVKALGGTRRIVFLVDSLDRVSHFASFSTLVEQDMAVLMALKVGLVMVGPLRSLGGFGRMYADRFERVHVQSPVDVVRDEKGRSFLVQVVRRRIASDVLPDDALNTLVTVSGGVLRDLISLSRFAVEEAYAGGANTIDAAHVERAADAFGRSMVVGLSSRELNALKGVKATDSFVPSVESDFALIATRRILQYSGPRPRFSVHPCISPLLDKIAA
ncbi:MAG TPA: hypothetical protein VGH20_20920 [Myxococcales bacterium]